MPWATPTVEDVLCGLSKKEREAFVDPGAEAKVEQLISEQVSSIRGAIRCCPRKYTSVGPSGTVPLGAIPHVRYLVIYQLYASSLSSKIPSRIEGLWQKACSWFSSVARCDAGIEPHEDTASTTDGGYGKIVGGQKGKRSGCKLPNQRSDWGA